MVDVLATLDYPTLFSEPTKRCATFAHCLCRASLRAACPWPRDQRVRATAPAVNVAAGGGVGRGLARRPIWYRMHEAHARRARPRRSLWLDQSRRFLPRPLAPLGRPLGLGGGSAKKWPNCSL